MQVIQLTQKELDDIIESSWNAGQCNCNTWSASDYFNRRKNKNKITDVPQRTEEV